MGSHHVLLNRGDVRVWTGSLRMGRVAPTGGSLAMITLSDTSEGCARWHTHGAGVLAPGLVDLWVMRRTEPVPHLPSDPAASRLARDDRPWCPTPADRYPWRPYYHFYYGSSGPLRAPVLASPQDETCTAPWRIGSAPTLLCGCNPWPMSCAPSWWTASTCGLRSFTSRSIDSESAARLARNVEALVKVEKRRAKLLGVDAPEHVEVTVVEISQEDVALADLVREAAAAVAEQQLRERTKPC